MELGHHYAVGVEVYEGDVALTLYKPHGFEQSIDLLNGEGRISIGHRSATFREWLNKPISEKDKSFLSCTSCREWRHGKQSPGQSIPAALLQGCRLGLVTEHQMQIDGYECDCSSKQQSAWTPSDLGR